MKLEENIEDTGNQYVIKKLLNKQVTQGWTKYLVQWLGYSPEHNDWYNTRDLGAATRLISDYKQSRPMVSSNTQFRTTVQARLAQE